MYKGETVLYGALKGKQILTLNDALDYISWQYNTAHILPREFYYQVQLAQLEFKED